MRFTQGSTLISWQTGLYGETFTTTAAIPAAATSATLSTAWTGTTGALTSYFSDGSSQSITYTNGSTVITWAGGLTGTVEAVVRTFETDTTISTMGVQGYPIPANVAKIKNGTITVGQIQYTPAPVQTIDEWTQLNAIPYSANYPAYFFIYGNVVYFMPIPSTSGNLITFNYQARVSDLSYSDYTTGTISAATAGSNVLTGSATTWTAFPQNVDLSYTNLMVRITPPDGDGLWYPIQRFTSATSVTLNLPIVNINELTSATYTIGQMPLLYEDFHDMLVFGALKVYFTSIVTDESKFDMYNTLYEQKLELMKAFLGTKSVNVNLGARPYQVNPNIFYSGGSSL